MAGHKLTALKLNLTALERGGDAAAPASIRVASQLATELLSDIRGVVAQIRQHDGLDLRQALAQIITPLPSPKIHLDLRDDARVDSVAQAETLLRVVQEALTNIWKHASATRASVSVTFEPERCVVQIADDGVGFDVSAVGPNGQGEHLGIAGIRERAEMLGGTLRIASAPSAGTTLLVSVPTGVRRTGEEVER